MPHTNARPPTTIPPPPDPNHVYFARQPFGTLELSDDMKQRRSLAERLVTVAYFGVALAGAEALRVLRLGGTISLLTWFALLALTAGAVYLLRKFRKRRFVNKYRGYLPLFTSPEARLACIGDPQTWSDSLPMADMPIEPAFFRGGFGAWPARGELAAFATFAVGLAVFVALIWWKWIRSGNPVRGGWYFEISAAVVAAQATRAFLWPIYLRLVPGRLDVMHFSAFGRKVRKLERVPLREAKILVNLLDRYAIIDADKRHELSLLLMPEYKAFTHTLFLAAISTYTPPPLPDDDLLG